MEKFSTRVGSSPLDQPRHSSFGLELHLNMHGNFNKDHCKSEVGDNGTDIVFVNDVVIAVKLDDRKSE